MVKTFLVLVVVFFCFSGVVLGRNALEGPSAISRYDGERWNIAFLDQDNVFTGNNTFANITFSTVNYVTYNITDFLCDDSGCYTLSELNASGGGDNVSWSEARYNVIRPTHLSNFTNDLGLGGDNTSWNESYADGLYADIRWGYNQTFDPSDLLANDSRIDIRYESLIDNSSYLSTFNATYDALVGDNSSWNEGRALLLIDNGSIIRVGNVSWINQSGLLLNWSNVISGGGNVSVNGSLLFGQIVGFTAGFFDGNIVNGSDVGYVAANGICGQEFVGSHFCLEVEVMKTIVNGNYSISGTYWMQKGAPGYTANADDCAGWTSDSNVFLGPFWNWDGNVQAGYGRLTNCAQVKQLMCCR